MASDPKTGSASYRLRDNWGSEIAVAGTETSVTWKYPHLPLHPREPLFVLDVRGGRGRQQVVRQQPRDRESPTGHESAYGTGILGHERGHEAHLAGVVVDGRQPVDFRSGDQGRRPDQQWVDLRDIENVHPA